ncbi:MAG: hypothetical protein RIQ94_2997 [Pseudomonadota bacterium]
MPLNSSYNDLITKINQWDHEYYVLDNPSVSDAEYDQTFRKLLDLEADNPALITAQSPSQRVGAKPLAEYRKIEHAVKMLSLANAFTLEETYSFFEKAAKELDIPPSTRIYPHQHSQFLANPNLMVWLFPFIMKKVF